MKRVKLSKLRLGSTFKLFPESSQYYIAYRNDVDTILCLHRKLNDTNIYFSQIPSDITVYPF